MLEQVKGAEESAPLATATDKIIAVLGYKHNLFETETFATKNKAARHILGVCHELRPQDALIVLAEIDILVKARALEESVLTEMLTSSHKS